MEQLEEKLIALIERLEEIKEHPHHTKDSLREQIDIIENKELPKLDEEFDELRNQLYDEVIQDEAVERLIDQIGDQFIQADELINSIREQYGLEEDLEDDDELVRSLLNDNEDDGEDNDEYDIVLNEVSKSALQAIGFDNNDSQSLDLMGSILIGISSNESDDAIAGRAFAQLVMSGVMLPVDDIKEMCRRTREKCQKQVFGLQIAFNSLRKYNCSALEALSQIEKFL